MVPGVVSVVRVPVQYATIGYFFLQSVIAVLGLPVTTLVALRSMRDYYWADEAISLLGLGETRDSPQR